VPDRFFLRHRVPKDQCIGHACCNPDHLQTALSAKGAPAPILADGNPIPFRVCPKGHLMTPENTVVERTRPGKSMVDGSGQQGIGYFAILAA
jgi:hypothetical protein